MDWVSFHTHTTFSYGDGFGTVAEHVRRVADLGMPALALTEHGNPNSHVTLERECRKAEIKPIYGLEAYFGGVDEDNRSQRKFHITLIAQDEQGYRNLNQIITQSYLDSYYWPTVSPESLKKHAKGIVALSGCSDSLISCTLLGGKSLGDKRQQFTDAQKRNTRRKIQWFVDVFEDRFYLEVQRFPGLPRTCVLNPTFAEISRDTGVPLIATADVHYPFPHQNKMQSLLHAARRSSTIAVTESAWEYDILLTYPQSISKLRRDIIRTGIVPSQADIAISNSVKLAESCNVELPKAKALRFPGVDISGLSEDNRRIVTKKFMWKKLREGWKQRITERPLLKDEAERYNDRLKQEMKVISGKDFCDYFLATADLVTYAKGENVTVGPGRGSAAGSLVCYVLGITEIDPLHPTFEKTIFERFIDPTRSDMPDIDIDFDDELRYKTPLRAREIYGDENVANVGNHIKYRGKKALQDVARAYGLGQKVFDPIGEKCSMRTETDERVDDSILDVIESYSTDPAIRSLVGHFGTAIQQAVQLEGNQHSMGIHAGGFVIASQPIPDVCAIFTKDKAGGESAQVIPYDKRDAEYLNMLKMDFLGLTTMGVIGKIRNWTGMTLPTLYAMYYNDYDNGEVWSKLVLEKFRDDDLDGIFQYEGGTTRQVVREVQPMNFHELAACNALSRPGPFYGGQTKEYIAVKRGDYAWERIHENFDKHVEWTYGQIVYQEQIMFILRDLAGFDIASVLRVRKIIGKKLGEHQFESIWKDFRDGCSSTSGVSEESSAKIFAAIRTAAGYAFNVAHAYSYALIAWWLAIFKVSDTAEFFAASLARNGDGKDDLPRRVALLQDAERHGIKVLSLDPAMAGETWQPVAKQNTITPGFRQISGVGEVTARDILKWRAETYPDYGIGNRRPGPSWPDLIAVKGVGPKTIEKIIEFVSKPDPFDVHKVEKQLAVFRNQCLNGEFDPYGLPSADEFADSRGFPAGSSGVAYVGIAGNIVYRDEIESIRSRTGKSVEEIKADLDNPEATKKATIFCHDEFGEAVLRISRWRYEALQDRLAAIKPGHHIVVAYGRTFEEKSSVLQVKEIWILSPD